MYDAEKIADLESRLTQQEHTLDELPEGVAGQARVNFGAPPA